MEPAFSETKRKSKDIQILQETLRKNLNHTLQKVVLTPEEHPAFLLYDERTPLAQLLAITYQAVLPHAHHLDFDTKNEQEILEQINHLEKGTLVVLIQSSSFRLNAFRFRIELFKLGLKVIEHHHLERILPEEFAAYADSLAYDKTYYERVGPALKSRLDVCETVELVCPNTRLFYRSRFEESRLNIAEYQHLKNVGGQFPIGEVFSEPKHLDCVEGEIEIFAFGDEQFSVKVPESPFILKIEKGTVVNTLGAPAEFEKILEEIQKVEGKIWIRELGFGLNRAFSKERRVSDIGAYERMCGVHLSVGAKHAMYTKAGFPKKKCKFHVDVFADTQQVLIDQEVVFEKGEYRV